MKLLHFRCSTIFFPQIPLTYPKYDSFLELRRYRRFQMNLIERLKNDLTNSMKARQNLRVATLRTMLSALDNATAVEVDVSYVPMEGVTPDVPRKELSESDQLVILTKEAEARRHAVVQYEQLGKSQEAARLRAELEVFEDYLNEP
jgi:uncharacterized protein YqeY